MEKQLALLIPGLDGTGRLYYRQMKALSEKYRPLAWEFRHRASFSLPDLVEELAQGTAGEESMVVIAESFGGMIALQFALLYPNRISRLVMINTFPFYRRKAKIRLACTLSGLLEMPLARKLKDFIAERILAFEGIPPADILGYRQAIALVHRPAYCRRLQLIRDTDLRSRLPEIRIPTTFLASGRDKLVPAIQEARFMQSVIPGAKLFEFPHAGHALLLSPDFNLADYLD